MTDTAADEAFVAARIEAALEQGTVDGRAQRELERALAELEPARARD